MAIFNTKNNKFLLLLALTGAFVLFFHSKFFCGGCNTESFCGDGCGIEFGNQFEAPKAPQAPIENFSSCYRSKQIYLNSCNPDEPSCHADVNLEHRFGKLFIKINANLPYAKGGVFNTMWGAYHAFLVDSRDGKSINLGSLVRHGDRFYKLSTELLGEYGNFDHITVYRQTEDYSPKKVLTGSITSQSCSSL